MQYHRIHRRYVRIIVLLIGFINLTVELTVDIALVVPLIIVAGRLVQTKGCTFLKLTALILQTIFVDYITKIRIVELEKIGVIGFGITVRQVFLIPRQ